MSSTGPSVAAVGVLLLVVLAAPVASVAAGDVDAGGPGTAADPGPGADDRLGQQVDADNVRMTVALRADGDAGWTVTYRVLLEDENETQAFETLQSDVESDPDNYTERFADRMRSTAGAAENATGREMTVRNVTVDARIQELGRTYGILEYTFEWTNFAAVEDDTLRAGDAIAGLFLDEGTTLVIAWPEGYSLRSVRPDPSADVGGNRSVGWRGAQDFAADEPLVVVEPATPTPDGPRGEGITGTALVAVVVVAALGLGAGLLWRRRQSGGGAVDDGGPGGAGGGGEAPPEELLSNEEKVLKLVRERGGRVKQQEIVEAFDWTEAKTSQVVRDLRDQGDLEGFRLGRENVLRMPEVDDEELP